jgi:cysteine desulfurase
MHVNNEIGVMQRRRRGRSACAGDRGVLLHVDAAQSAGKVAHRRRGVMGSTCCRSPRTKCTARKASARCACGGNRGSASCHCSSAAGQERGLRSGTLSTHQIVGMGAAFRIARDQMSSDVERITGLRRQLWSQLSALPGVQLNGDAERRVAGILSVSIDGVEGESLLCALAEFAFSSGSACATTSAEPSYVLRALGRTDRLAQSSLRLSLGRFTTQQEVDLAAQRISAEVGRLRACLPGRPAGGAAMGPAGTHSTPGAPGVA